jgi:CrcB protein
MQPMMREIYLTAVVFVGAGFGGALRHGVNRAVAASLPLTFPLSTFLVNVVGCFLMGVLAGWFTFRGESSGQALRLLLTTGALGGFTTFSAFSLEAALLWERGATGTALTYVLASVVFTLVAVFGGLALMRAALH